MLQGDLWKHSLPLSEPLKMGDLHLMKNCSLPVCVSERLKECSLPTMLRFLWTYLVLSFNFLSQSVHLSHNGCFTDSETWNHLPCARGGGGGPSTHTQASLMRTLFWVLKILKPQRVWAGLVMTHLETFGKLFNCLSPTFWFEANLGLHR